MKNPPPVPKGLMIRPSALVYRATLGVKEYFIRFEYVGPKQFTVEVNLMDGMGYRDAGTLDASKQPPNPGTAWVFLAKLLPTANAA